MIITNILQERITMLTFICYPKCTTCQKAQKWLDQNGIAYQMRNIKTENPSAGELRRWSSTTNIAPRKFFNTSGLKYKELSLKDKLAGMNEEEQFSLLASDGMLIKRPLLISESGVLIGFKEAEWSQTLAK